jgi:hypothetical protein
MLTNIINRLVPYIPKSIPEGSSSVELLRFFTRLVQEDGRIRTIGETGFNTGASSRAFLAAREDTTVVSFDLGQHASVRPAKAGIERRYPGRHELVLGDSTKTLPDYARTRPDIRFDLVFIDGGHDYEVASADLHNFRPMCHERTVVIMDDLTPWWAWGEGPTRAWQEAIDGGVIVQAALFRNGRPVTELAGRWKDRIWAIGHYGSNHNQNGVSQ